LVVSNEVGMGVVPPSRLGRFFRDMLGLANQRFAGAADEVVLMVAGLPWTLKPYDR
jgi:adenosylcobinamide kinase/adenosylcobinamide-phosphate guanylyltransferase